MLPTSGYKWNIHLNQRWTQNFSLRQTQETILYSVIFLQTLWKFTILNSQSLLSEAVFDAIYTDVIREEWLFPLPVYRDIIKVADTDFHLLSR